MNTRMGLMFASPICKEIKGELGVKELGGVAIISITCDVLTSINGLSVCSRGVDFLLDDIQVSPSC